MSKDVFRNFIYDEDSFAKIFHDLQPFPGGIACLKLTIETLEQSVKYVQS